MIYDAMILGPTGQVGRHILRELMQRTSSIVAVMRRSSVYEAQDDLDTLGIGDVSCVDIVLGDAVDCDLPDARAVFNAAGNTNLSAGIQEHWAPNVLLNTRLATYCSDRVVPYHYISTVSTALFRRYHLLETNDPIPDVRMTPYTLTKVLGELAATSIVPPPLLRIYRICDVVPDLLRLEHDWRRDHWLSILTWAGKRAFDEIPHTRDFYLATGSEVGKAIVTLAHREHTVSRFHVIGNRYYAGYLASRSDMHITSNKAVQYGQQVARMLYRGEAWKWPIDGDSTRLYLESLGVTYQRLNDDYWTAFRDFTIARGLSQRTKETEVSSPS